MIFDWTSGGAPIYMPGARRKPKKNNNHRYRCGCGHRTTKNQLKANGGLCHSCKKPMKEPTNG